MIPNSEVLNKYFPSISDVQKEQIDSIIPVYEEWNAKINVISRKDIDNLFEHHILHSLAIAKTIDFAKGTTILDVGTGGGFPGIPLAIMFPEAEFTLIDSVGKKLTVADAAIKAAGLKNVRLIHRNAIEEKDKYNFVVSRAVMNAAQLLRMTNKNILRKQIDSQRNGLIVLKGGDISDELMELEKLKHSNKSLKGCKIKTFKINKFFKEEYFEEKYVIHVMI